MGFYRGYICVILGLWTISWKLLFRGTKAALNFGNYPYDLFLVVEPSKIIFLLYNTIPQKEDLILLSILGTIVSPNKILLNLGTTTPSIPLNNPYSTPLCSPI